MEGGCNPPNKSYGLGLLRRVAWGYGNAIFESLAHVGRQAPRNRFLIRISVPDRV